MADVEQNTIRVKELRAKVERQARVITKLEKSRKALKEQNVQLRAEALAIAQKLVDAERAVTDNCNFVLLVDALDMAEAFIEKQQRGADTWESLGRGFIDFPEPDQTYGAAD